VDVFFAFRVFYGDIFRSCHDMQGRKHPTLMRYEAKRNDHNGIANQKNNGK
jgi:hypothetical protein